MCRWGCLFFRKAKNRLTAKVKEPSKVSKSINVINKYNREVLFIETDYSLKGSWVSNILWNLVNKYGKVTKIWMADELEFVAKLAQEGSRINKYIKDSTSETQNTNLNQTILQF